MRLTKAILITCLIFTITLFAVQQLRGAGAGFEGDPIVAMINGAADLIPGFISPIDKQAKGQTLSGTMTVIYERVTEPAEIPTDCSGYMACGPGELYYPYFSVELEIDKRTAVFIYEADFRDLILEPNHPFLPFWQCYVDVADASFSTIPPCPQPKVPICYAVPDNVASRLLGDKFMSEVVLPKALGYPEGTVVGFVWKTIKTIAWDDSTPNQPIFGKFQFQVVITGF